MSGPHSEMCKCIRPICYNNVFEKSVHASKPGQERNVIDKTIEAYITMCSESSGWVMIT